jgi:hypothetical protein
VCVVPLSSISTKCTFLLAYRSPRIFDTSERVCNSCLFHFFTNFREGYLLAAWSNFCCCFNPLFTGRHFLISEHLSTTPFLTSSNLDFDILQTKSIRECSRGATQCRRHRIFKVGEWKRKWAAHKNFFSWRNLFLQISQANPFVRTLTLSPSSRGDCSIQETRTKMRETSQYEQGRSISMRKRNNNKDLVVQTAVHNLKLKHNIKARNITLRRYLEGRTSRIKSFQALF